jgi:hypothetical protein
MSIYNSATRETASQNGRKTASQKWKENIFFNQKFEICKGKRKNNTLLRVKVIMRTRLRYDTDVGLTREFKTLDND